MKPRTDPLSKRRRGALFTVAKAAHRSVWWHDLKMSIARWVLTSVGYDLDSLLFLAETAIFKECVRACWMKDGRCSAREWLQAERAQRWAAVEVMRRHRRALKRRPTR